MGNVALVSAVSDSGMEKRMKMLPASRKMTGQGALRLMADLHRLKEVPPQGKQGDGIGERLEKEKPDGTGLSILS